jgi:hypothetical protein
MADSDDLDGPEDRPQAPLPRIDLLSKSSPDGGRNLFSDGDAAADSDLVRSLFALEEVKAEDGPLPVAEIEVPGSSDPETDGEAGPLFVSETGIPDPGAETSTRDAVPPPPPVVHAAAGAPSAPTPEEAERFLRSAETLTARPDGKEPRRRGLNWLFGRGEKRGKPAGATEPGMPAAEIARDMPIDLRQIDPAQAQATEIPDVAVTIDLKPEPPAVPAAPRPEREASRLILGPAPGKTEAFAADVDRMAPEKGENETAIPTAPGASADRSEAMEGSVGLTEVSGLAANSAGPGSPDMWKTPGAPPPAPSAKAGRARSRRGAPPIQVLIGWIGDSSRKDVIEHAKGFAEDHIETLETAWIALEQFRNGWIFEIHEGGAGLSYLPEVIEELSRDPDQVVWLPSGTGLNRVLTVRISEEQVFATILTEAESALVRKSGQDPLERTGRMRRLVPKGGLALAIGASLASVATITLLGTLQYAMMIDQRPLASRNFNPETLPHSQIVRLSGAIREDRWVSRIVFEEGQWRAEFEEVAAIKLPVEDEGAQKVIDDLYEEEERIRRSVRESIERETAQ